MRYRPEKNLLGIFWFLGFKLPIQTIFIGMMNSILAFVASFWLRYLLLKFQVIKKIPKELFFYFLKMTFQGKFLLLKKIKKNKWNNLRFFEVLCVLELVIICSSLRRFWTTKTPFCFFFQGQTKQVIGKLFF